MPAEIAIDFTKSAQENAQRYFEMSKKARKKAEGAEKSANELKEQFKAKQEEEPEKRRLRRVAKREWYEKFNWFFTSSSMLAIGGRSAQQNELINSKYFGQKDLFFHADVFGASVTILKDGVSSSREAREEVAQFAACFSSAWENGSTAADVYSLKREQITKSTGKGSLGTGSFLMTGEREWFRNMPLELCAFAEQGKSGDLEVRIVPSLTCSRKGIKGFLTLKPGNSKKSDAAKYIAKKLGYDDIDYIMQHLPAGSFSVK
ncbi:MAG: NFACT RNA binding domain-containing protein [Candidatus Micrarchaeaceae archaeon]